MPKLTCDATELHVVMSYDLLICPMTSRIKTGTYPHSSRSLVGDFRVMEIDSASAA